VIELVSYPHNLGAWDSEKQPYYLELYGETRPVVDRRFAEVQPAGSVDGKAQTASVTPVYEYWWTIGRHVSEYERGDPGHSIGWPDRQPDLAAHVTLYFPLTGGWRISEISSSVKYLPPLPRQTNITAKISKDAATFAPAIAEFGEIAGLPGEAMGAATTLLSAIAKLEINKVPQAEGFDWHVRKVTLREGSEILQGIRWMLPRRLFDELGGRLTGSLAVSFLPAYVQKGGVPTDEEPVFQPGAIRAHAVIFQSDEEPIWMPSKSKFVRLQLAPR